MKILMIIPLTFLVSFLSCNNVPKAENTLIKDTVSQVITLPDGVKTNDSEIKVPIAGEEKKTRQDTVIPKPSSNSDRYSLIVSFFSKGAGKDREALDKFNELLENYKNKVLVEKFTWGREGEIDFCIRTEKMRPAEQKEFIRQAKSILENSELVHVEENAACLHKS